MSADPRMPPHDSAAEEAVLGCVLMSATALGDVVSILLPGDFYKPIHQTMWAAIENIWRRGDPIDAVTVSGEMTEMDADFDSGMLMELQAATPSISRARVYADRIVRASRLRAVVAANAESTDAAFQPNADPDAIHSLIVSLANDQRILPRDVKLPDSLLSMGEFLDRILKRPDDENEVIVPSMLKKRWRALFISTEGTGKSMMLRQIATLVANGLHPFVAGGMVIPPRRVLIIDAENPEDVIVEQAEMIDCLAKTSLSHNDNLKIWHVEGGLNLRQRKDQAQMEAVVQHVRPELVTMGPIYKLYANGNTDLEQSATEFVSFLDGLRARFGFALLMEHHAPKGSGGSRELVPFGSSVWQRWPEFGFKLLPGDRDEAGHPQMLRVRRFRGDRVRAQWPRDLVRGSQVDGVPWKGIWSDGTWSKPVQNEESPPPDEEEEF